MVAPVNTSSLLQVDAAGGGSTSTIGAGFTFTAGNDAVFKCSHWNNNAGQYISTVTIGGTAAALRSRAANGQFVAEIWVAESIAGGTPNVAITFAAGSSGNYLSGGAQEYAAADNLTYDTGTANNATGTGTAPSVATAATTSQADTVVIGVATAGVGGNSNVGLSGPSGWTATWTEQDDSNHVAGRGAYSEETTAGVKTATFAQTASGTWAAAIAAFTVTVGAPPQEAYPNADVTDGAWTPSAGTDLFAVLDDASDADYIATNSNTTGKIGLAALSTPVAGTQTLAFRASGSPAKKLIATLIEGVSTSRGTVTVDPLPATATDYSFSPSGISNYGDLDIQYEIADATTPPTPSVSFGAIGTGINGTTSISVPVPTGIVAGNYLLIHVTSGATSSNTPDTPDGWTLLATGASTDGTFGIDTGPRRATVFGKPAVGGETAVTVTTTTGNTVRGTMSRWVLGHAGYSWDVVAEGANDSTSGTGVSMTTAAIDWSAGDCAAVVVGQRVDSATQSAQSLTASGTTFGARTNRATTAVTTGNDHRHVVDTFAAVTTGGGSAATTWAYAASAAVSAGGVIVRLREVPPTEFGRVYTTKLTIPEADGGGGATYTLTASADAAVQGERTATAGATAAVQGEASGSASLAAAVQEAKALSAGLDAVVQAAIAANVGATAAVQGERTAGASAAAAVQDAHTVTADASAAVAASGAATSSADTAIQAAAGATASLAAAVQAAISTGATVDLVVLTTSGASASVDAVVVASSTQELTTTLAAAVQAGLSAGASLDAAVLAATGATVGVDVYVVVAGTTEINALLSAAVQGERTATAALDAAIRQGGQAATTLDAVVGQANASTAVVAAAVQGERSSTTSLAAAVEAGLAASVTMGAYIIASDADGVLCVRLTVSLAKAVETITDVARQVNLNAEISRDVSLTTEATQCRIG